MGENMGMCAVLAQASASSSVERACIASIQYFTVRAEILRGELEIVANMKMLPIPVLPMTNSNAQLEIGNIGTGNISTLATFSKPISLIIDICDS